MESETSPITVENFQAALLGIQKIIANPEDTDSKREWPNTKRKLRRMVKGVDTLIKTPRKKRITSSPNITSSPGSPASISYPAQPLRRLRLSSKSPPISQQPQRILESEPELLSLQSQQLIAPRSLPLQSQRLGSMQPQQVTAPGLPLQSQLLGSLPLQSQQLNFSHRPTKAVGFHELPDRIEGHVTDRSRCFGYVHLRIEAHDFDYSRSGNDIPQYPIGWGHKVSVALHNPLIMIVEQMEEDGSEGSSATTIPDFRSETIAVPDIQSCLQALAKCGEALCDQKTDYFCYEGDDEEVRRAVGLNSHALTCGLRLDKTRTRGIRLGLHVPLIYLSAGTSAFPAYKSNAGLRSMTLLHAGCARVHVVIHPSYTSAFESRFAEFVSDEATCSQSTTHCSLLPSITALTEAAIEFTVVFQLPGEVVLILEDVYCFGYNLGANCTESILVSGPSWRAPSHYIFCTEESCGYEAITYENLILEDDVPLFCTPAETSISSSPAEGSALLSDLAFDLRCPSNRDDTSSISYLYQNTVSTSAKEKEMDACALTLSESSVTVTHGLGIRRDGAVNEGQFGRYYPTPSPERIQQSTVSSDAWLHCLVQAAKSVGFPASQLTSIEHMWNSRPVYRGKPSYLIRVVQLVCEVSAPTTLRHLRDALANVKGLQEVDSSRTESPLASLVHKCLLAESLDTTHNVVTLFRRRKLQIELWREFKFYVRTEEGACTLNWDAIDDHNIISLTGYRVAKRKLEMQRNPANGQELGDIWGKNIYSGRVLSQFLGDLDMHALLLFPGYDGQELLLDLCHHNPPDPEEFVSHAFSKPDRIIHFRSSNTLAKDIVKYAGDFLPLLHPYLSKLDLENVYRQLNALPSTSIPLVDCTDEDIKAAWRNGTIWRLFILNS